MSPRLQRQCRGYISFRYINWAVMITSLLMALSLKRNSPSRTFSQDWLVAFLSCWWCCLTNKYFIGSMLLFDSLSPILLVSPHKLAFISIEERSRRPGRDGKEWRLLLFLSYDGDIVRYTTTIAIVHHSYRTYVNKTLPDKNYRTSQKKKRTYMPSIVRYTSTIFIVRM